jgi:hypothetical protein
VGYHRLRKCNGVLGMQLKTRLVPV